MTTCSKIYRDIPFAHRAPGHDGHCKTIHGHNWTFEFEFEGEKDPATGFVVDFGTLQPLKAWLDLFDHALVLSMDDPHRNEIKELLAKLGIDNVMVVEDCSCEGLAELALCSGRAIVEELTKYRATVKKVTLWEDSKNFTTAT